jgi:dihydroorotase
MLPTHFVIQRARVWNSSGDLGLQFVEIQNGKIAQLRDWRVEDLEQNLVERVDSIDFNGDLLLPAGVDPQVHLRVPGQPEKETAETGLRAALCGGLGAIVTMPNTRPVIDTVEILEAARADVQDAHNRYGVEVFWTAALTRGQEGRELVDFDALSKAGVVAFTDDGKGVADGAVMRRCLEAAAKCGKPVLQHAEMPGHGGVLAPSGVQRELGVSAYTADPEVEMVRRDLELLKTCPGARYHVLHVSSARTVELLASAQRQGLAATGEASPHHLMYTVEDIQATDTSWKMNPPLRTVEDREVLRQALSDGVLSFMATDHAPHEAAAKGRGFKEAPFGTTGLEALLKVMLELHKNKYLTPKRAVEVWSLAAAKFLGLEGFGDLKPGQQLRAVWVHTGSAPRPLEASELQSLSKNSVFLGQSLSGELRGVFNPKGFFRF